MKERRPQRAAHHNVRQRILEAAETLFADKGFDATSISDISSLSGAGRSLIYYHFKDKQDLYASILQDGEARMLQIAEEASSSEGTALDKLRLFMAAFSQMHVRRQAFIRVAMRVQLDDSLGLNKHAEDGFGRLSAVLAQIVKDGMARGELRPLDPERTVHMVLGLAHSLVIMQLKAMPDSSPDENVQFAMSVLAHGITRQP
jgi:TetR/AcrR family transcriptional regulator